MAKTEGKIIFDMGANDYKKFPIIDLPFPNIQDRLFSEYIELTKNSIMGIDQGVKDDVSVAFFRYDPGHNRKEYITSVKIRAYEKGEEFSLASLFPKGRKVGRKKDNSNGA
jgi:hypothetical protein